MNVLLQPERPPFISVARRKEREREREREKTFSLAPRPALLLRLCLHFLLLRLRFRFLRSFFWCAIAGRPIFFISFDISSDRLADSSVSSFSVLFINAFTVSFPLFFLFTSFCFPRSAEIFFGDATASIHHRLSAVELVAVSLK